MASVRIPGLSWDVTIVYVASVRIPGLSWDVTIAHAASVGIPGLSWDVTIVHVASAGIPGLSWDVTIAHVASVGIPGGVDLEGVLWVQGRRVRANPPGIPFSNLQFLERQGSAEVQCSRPNQQLVSPASLLDSQHGCITSPHAKKESGQTPYAVWSPLVQEFLGQGSGFDCCGVWFLFIFADSATTFADSARPNYQRSLTRLLLRVR